MRRNLFFRWVLAGLWIGILFVPGCGKKGDPIIPAQLRLPAAISDLSAVPSAEGMVLRWQAPFPVVPAGSFRILRSDTKAAEACPGCPQDYRTLVQLPLGDGRLQRDGERGIRYFDGSVRAGYFYSYRVTLCNPRGDCAEASNAAQGVYQKH
jgi:hypothetical protein